MAYMDNTGTYVKIGTETAVPLTGGEYRTYGELREIELTLTLSQATAIGSPFIINDQVFMPKGVIIQEVEWYCTTVGAGSSSTLDLGFVATDRTTEIDFNGLLAAVAVATLTAGTKTVVVKGGTGAGAMLGSATPTTTVGYFCMNYNTAVFTGGVLKVRVRYFRP